ncbi:MAG: hypothetical protein F6J93_29710 [Oscillatoria sp. SIO1A7]|nr:hypothetical protein [Oscillatoria sp. SIO1A7]
MKEQLQNAYGKVDLGISQKQDKVNPNMPSQKAGGWRKMVTPLALVSATVIGLSIPAVNSIGTVSQSLSLDDLKQEAKEQAIKAVFGDGFEDNGSNTYASLYHGWPWHF